jgi:phage terminase large subunit-like protein
VAKRGDPRLKRAYRSRFRDKVLARDNYTCAYCGQEADQVDHVIPISKAPELVINFDNAVASCRRCNISKGNRSQGVFLARTATLYTNGNEAIILKSGARLDVRAATRDSARGATADFLFVDELREVDPEAFAAALPVTRAKPNSQTLLASNAGDAFSTTLNELRERCQSNPPPSLGYYEYSAPPLCALDDRKGWAAANPALGILITEKR